jgi:hypothetical protein
VAAAITEWPASSSFPYVNVRTSLGPTGDIEAGTAALLAGERIREQDFSLEVGSLLFLCCLFDLTRWCLKVGKSCVSPHAWGISILDVVSWVDIASLGPTKDIAADIAALLAGEGISQQDCSLEVSAV